MAWRKVNLAALDPSAMADFCGTHCRSPLKREIFTESILATLAAFSVFNERARPSSVSCGLLLQSGGDDGPLIRHPADRVLAIPRLGKNLFFFECIKWTISPLFC